MVNAWMHRWSWAVAMGVAIVMTVGGLIILESGRIRIAHEYETALDAKAAAARITGLNAGLALLAASERGVRLDPEGAWQGTGREALVKARALADELASYFNDPREFSPVDSETQSRARFKRLFPALDQSLRNGKSPSADSLRDIDAQLLALHDAEERHAQHALEASRADQHMSTLCVAALSALNIVLFVLLFRNLGIQIDKQNRVQSQLLTQQHELDRLVRERTAQLEALAWHLQSVSEDEKTELARELHDELGSILTASKMDVAWVHGKLRELDPAGADKLARALVNLDHGIALKRRIIEDMRPTVLTNFGLVTALRTLAEEAAQRNHWRLRLQLPDADMALDEKVAIALFRVAQESLNNAAKYASASHVAVSLQVEPGNVTLEILDNGIGIQPEDFTRSQTHGLLGMRQRVAARGGVFEVRRRQPRGTEVRVAMPAEPGHIDVAADQPWNGTERRDPGASGTLGTPGATPGSVPDAASPTATARMSGFVGKR
jgi:signal transduction histidine kinase